MRINYNVSAAIANKHLLGIQDNLGKTMERLSSGLKINDAKDNPAGMAISNKMKAQIDGLNRASQNASDGISVIRVAEGALGEVTSMLQRLRELAVQAANDTNSLEDRQAIQAEVDSLTAEIDRVSTDTEYNSKTLLDGSLDTRVYTKTDGGRGTASRVQISDEVRPGKYELTIEKAATQAGPVATTGVDFTKDGEIGVAGSLSINGSIIEFSETDKLNEVFEKLRNGAEIGEADISLAADGTISMQSTAYGKGSVLELSFSSEEIATELGFDDTKLEEDTDTKRWIYKETVKVPDPGNLGNTIDVKQLPVGADPVATLIMPGDGTGFGNTATVSYEGNRIFVTDVSGFRLSFLAQEGYAKDAAKPGGGTYDGKIEFEVSTIGMMTLHIGSNMDQNMGVRVPEVSAKSLFVDDVDVTTVTGADRAITAYSRAVDYVSDVRSKLGAYDNRLEYTTDNLNAFEENMTGALSRLTDADMAKEMTDYTHRNVLNQAAISVLTQANDLPQQVLQILR
ncbi:MAG: flagellin [Clostridiales bacterium]|nr:flagellin [Clostridiales bacterium]